jgi:hypothetical protein
MRMSAGYARPGVRRAMGFVYLAALVMWVIVGAKRAMPLAVVAVAIAFCLLRVWLAFRPRPDVERP